MVMVVSSSGGSVWSHVHFDEKIEFIMELIHSRDCLLFAH